MFSIKELEMIFLLVSFLGSFLIASSVVYPYVPFIPQERFSELYILGSTHSAGNYPFIIKVGENYTFYLGISNHEGFSSYYRLFAKIRGKGEPLPDPVMAKPSILTSFCEHSIVLNHGETWEKSFILKFPVFALVGDQIYIPELILNGNTFILNKTIVWDVEKGGYYAELFFELWIYDSATASFKYHNRFVGIQFNMSLVSYS